jgi:hypothetical protein
MMYIYLRLRWSVYAPVTLLAEDVRKLAIIHASSHASGLFVLRGACSPLCLVLR